MVTSLAPSRFVSSLRHLHLTLALNLRLELTLLLCCGDGTHHAPGSSVSLVCRLLRCTL